MTPNAFLVATSAVLAAKSDFSKISSSKSTSKNLSPRSHFLPLLLLYCVLPCCFVNRKRTHVGKMGCAAGAASRGEAPGPTGRTEVESNGETRTKLVHFDGHPAFTLEELMAASEVDLGEGAYGTVHLATLNDGKQVALRRLRWGDIRMEEFETEVNRLGKIRHPNLLALGAYYFSPKAEECFLVFDYMPKGTLSAFLHGRLRFVIPHWDDPALGPYNFIDWPTRKNIAIGITRGLHYLHSQRNIVHGNLTSRNVLLDNHSTAKLADYGLYHLMAPAANSNVITTAWASGYHAPELFKFNKPNRKTDVYNLGVIMLELLTGRSPTWTKNGLRLPEWVAWIVQKEGTDKVFDPDLIMDAAWTMGNELRRTLTLALCCVDSSPDARPDVWQVLQQLEGVNPKFAEAKGAVTTKGGDKLTDERANAAGDMTTAAPTSGVDISSSSLSDMSEERMTHLPKDHLVETSDTSNIFANDENLQAQMVALTNSHKDKVVEELARLRSNGDLEGNDQIPSPTPAEEIIQDHSGSEDSFDSSSTARPEGNNGAFFPTFNMDEAIVKDKSAERLRTEGTDAMTGDTAASQLSSIDWSEIPVEASLEVPTSPPLFSSDPDAGYQHYFQRLYDLAYHSPPLPSNVLEVQLNRMILGLHSLGYPLDTWVKAAVLVLSLAKKREYIEHHVDDYFKVHVETQLAELATAIDPVKEKVLRTQSDMATLEQKQKEIDESIANLEDQLAILKSQREEVVDSLTTSRDQLAVAEAKMQSVLVDIERLNQQYSAISDLRYELLRELPSLDEAFDSSFQEILSKQF